MSEIEKSNSADAANANPVEPAAVETPSAAAPASPVWTEPAGQASTASDNAASSSASTGWTEHTPAAAPVSGYPQAAVTPPVASPTAQYPAAEYPVVGQAAAQYGSAPTPPAYPGQAYGGQVPPVYPVSGPGGPGVPPPPGGVGGMPVSGPAWNPPPKSGAGKTIAKVVAGTVAAGLIAICSGVTGAFVATQWDDNNGPSLLNGPKSTGTAPILDRNSVAGVADLAQKSVVSIQHGSGEGSGVVATADGYIVTNNHVVANAQGELTVVLSDGRKVPAKVVGTDPRTDLAVIKAEASGLTPAVFGDSGSMKVGDTVMAIGSPLGLKGSVTMGIVSAKGRTIAPGGGQTLSGLLQTDAPINPGNSGGALVNLKGEVIGINTAIATGGNEGGGNIGVGFAIPSDKAKAVADQLIKGQKVSHAFLGVKVTPAKTGGATIEEITPNSPAEKAGLTKGDVIRKFGDAVVNDSDDLVSAVQSGTVGQQVTVEYVRNGETKTTTVTLGEAS